MDIGSIFLILALMILVAMFVSRPFLEQKKALVTEGQDDHELSSLLAERDRLLNALQELDFDHTLGKIPDEDYPLQRSILLKQGADVLRQLDAMQADAQVGKVSDPVEDRIEAAIAARRADGSLAASSGRRAALVAPDDDLEALLSKRRRVRQEKAGGFCPQCGGPVQKSDRFCPKCGSALA
jgi:NADH pyrophosphatase NudC (nudix superfamily)